MAIVINKGHTGSKIDSPTRRTSASASLGSNGAASPTVRGRSVEANIGGTFTATVQLQQRNSPTGAWFSVGQATAPGVISYVAPMVRDTRLFISAYTSGTATYELVAGRP